jgi:6-phosphogluconolactonase/glucosamine-6-phosphate isomerase/deaminase
MTDINFGSLMFVISLSLVICLLISGNQKNDLRKQAVERGHAEYVVDSKGETTWQWKEKQ